MNNSPFRKSVNVRCIVEFNNPVNVHDMKCIAQHVISEVNYKNMLVKIGMNEHCIDTFDSFYLPTLHYISFRAHIKKPEEMVKLCIILQNTFASYLSKNIYSRFIPSDGTLSMQYTFNPIEKINDMCFYDVDIRSTGYVMEYYILNYGENNKKYQQKLQEIRKGSLVRKLDTDTVKTN